MSEDAVQAPGRNAMPLRLALLTIIACGLLLLEASAQQFQETAAPLPGPVHWTEAVIPADFDGDGDLDLLLCNCNGWRKPGDMGAPNDELLMPTLLIQTGRKDGVAVFADRSALWFPAEFKLYAKNAAVADFDGDGRLDIAWAVAFGKRQRLLLQDSAGGRFIDASAQIPDIVINANNVDFGDFDNDGDLDLIWVDSGPNSDRAPGGKARLCLNEGQGRFREAAEALGAENKIGAQNAKVLDIDGDFDLDIIVDGKSDVTQIYLNDGRAKFSLDLVRIPKPEPRTFERRGRKRTMTGKPYEIEWGDLDGDGDLDAVYMNYFGSGRAMYSKALLANRLVESGKLVFEVVKDAFVGRNEQDENDIALLDADGDGDLDVICAVLVSGKCEEKLFLNQGEIGTACMVEQKGAFTARTDGSLDLCVADLDGDGAYDVVTVQGESRRGGFENRYYRNLGPKDQRPPTLVRAAPNARLAAAALVDAGGLFVRAQFRDAVQDDNLCWIEAKLRWVYDGPKERSHGAAKMTHIGGQMFRAPLRPVAYLGSAGASIVWWIEAKDAAGNTLVTDRKTISIR
jgi:VCBS repeat protein